MDRFTDTVPTNRLYSVHVSSETSGVWFAYGLDYRGALAAAHEAHVHYRSFGVSPRGAVTIYSILNGEPTQQWPLDLPTERLVF